MFQPHRSFSRNNGSADFFCWPGFHLMPLAAPAGGTTQPFSLLAIGPGQKTADGCSNAGSRLGCAEARAKTRGDLAPRA